MPMADLDILLCVWIWRWSLLYLLNKSNNRISGTLVPFKPWEVQQHLAWTIYPSWRGLTHITQQIWGDQILSWSPTLHPK
jgi:hypothetical protein